MMRWIYRIFIGLAALLVLAMVVVQIVLWTNIPRRLVTNTIEDELGLRLTADRLRTGWFGNTSLENVSLALPLSEQSFLGVKTLKVKHTSLVALMLGRSLAVESIELDEPTITVRQDATGQWNFVEVGQLLARAAGSQTAEESQQGLPKLPSVKLVGGQITLTDNESHQAVLPLTVQGSPRGKLVWRYDVQVGTSIHIVGKLAPGLNWQHQITLTAENLDPFLKHWGISSYGAKLGGEWRGQVSDGKLVGRFLLNHLSAAHVPGSGDISASGSLDVQAGADSVAITPRRVTFKTSNPALPDLQLSAGTIMTDVNGVHADALQLTVFGGLAVVDARFDPKTLAADLTARWSNLALPKNITHSGTLTASLRTPFEGHPSIKLDLSSHGRTNSGSWNSEVAVRGLGQSWESIDWELSAPTLQWNGNHSFELTQLAGHVRQRGSQIELTELTLPQRPHMISRAAINLQTRNWYFWMDAGGAERAANWLIPIAFNINAWGDDQKYVLQSMNFNIAQAAIWAGGVYNRRVPNPVNLDVYLTQAPELSPETPIRGKFTGAFHVSGKLFGEPDQHFYPYLDIGGHFKTTDLVVLDRPIGDIDLALGGLDDDGNVDISTTRMSLLQGNWKAQIHRRADDQPTRIQLQVRALPAEQLAQLMNLENVTGTMDADWLFTIPKSLNAGDVKMDSSYKISGLNADGLAVDSATANVTLDEGYLKLNSLEAISGNGKATAKASFNLNDREHLELESTIDKWSFGTSTGAQVQLCGDTKLDINLRIGGATGPIHVTGDLLLNRSSLGHAELAMNWEGRVLDVGKIGGTILDGKLAGSGHIDLDRPLEAQGRMQWSGIDASALTAVSPAFKGLGGKYSGTITVAPAIEPRPLEPVRIDVNISARDGHFKSVKIGSGLIAVHAVAYANTNRAVLDHSDIAVAGGIVHLWARVGNKLVSRALQVDFENLQLDQIAHLERTDHGPMPGIVSGRFTLLSSGTDLGGVVGNGNVSLVQTDLGHFGPVNALYSAMHLGAGHGEPTGQGVAGLSIEQNVLTVNNFKFYNRGVDAAGIFRLGPSVWNPGPAPIGGEIAGTLRPLKNSRVGILSDVDEIFGTVQGALTPLILSGTVDKPSYVPASLDQLGGTVRDLLGMH